VDEQEELGSKGAGWALVFGILGALKSVVTRDADLLKWVKEYV
jgi:hypothetical protein